MWEWLPATNNTLDFQFAGRLGLMHTLIYQNQDVQSRVKAGNLI